MTDKRKYTRKNGDLSVTAWGRYSSDSSQLTFHEGNTVNIGLGGMLVEVDKPAQEGMCILARLEDKKLAETVWTYGQVVRSEENGMAIEFLRGERSESLVQLLKLQP